MLAYTYIEKGKFELREKSIPTLQSPKDAIVKVTKEMRFGHSLSCLFDDFHILTCPFYGVLASRACYLIRIQ